MDALLENPLHAFFPDTIPEIIKIAGVKREPVPKEDLPEEMLPIRIFQPPLHYRHIFKIIDLLQR